MFIYFLGFVYLFFKSPYVCVCVCFWAQHVMVFTMETADRLLQMTTAKILNKIGLITAGAGALWWRGGCGRICWVVFFNFLSSLFSSLFTFIQETLLIFHQIHLGWKTRRVQVTGWGLLPQVVQLYKVHVDDVAWLESSHRCPNVAWLPPQLAQLWVVLCEHVDGELASAILTW